MTPHIFAAAHIRMPDVAHPDGRFPRIRACLELLLGRRPYHDSRIRERREQFRRLAMRAAADFKAAGDTNSAKACRRLADEVAL